MSFAVIPWIDSLVPRDCPSLDFMVSIRWPHIVALFSTSLALLCGGCSTPPVFGCSSDSECRGERICVRNACMYPHEFDAGVGTDTADELCGNGELDPGETCDRALGPEHPYGCPTVCAQETCFRPVLIGSARDCSAECKWTRVSRCIDGDGCCPFGCDEQSDDDCSPSCGDGVIQEHETCDGNCPTRSDCDDFDPCTQDHLEGSAASCSAQCVFTDVAQCIDNDGCCARGCGVAEDTDCQFVCGNAVLEPPEKCDNAIPPPEEGACPQSPADCDDADRCTLDEVAGLAADCSAECIHHEIVDTVTNDGCCLPTAPVAREAVDCQPLCEQYCALAVANCALYVDANGSGDTMDECLEACSDFEFVAGEEMDQATDSLWCRINQAELAANDSATHCPNADVSGGNACD